MVNSCVCGGGSSEGQIGGRRSSLRMAVQVRWKVVHQCLCSILASSLHGLDSIVDGSFSIEISCYSPGHWCQGLWGNSKAEQRTYRSGKFIKIGEEWPATLWQCVHFCLSKPSGLVDCKRGEPPNHNAYSFEGFKYESLTRTGAT